tara:strand:- start:4786 stop:6081 length:1296 start_codon:yes stop_codon:yes gene_type:complete
MDCNKQYKYYLHLINIYQLNIYDKTLLFNLIFDALEISLQELKNIFHYVIHDDLYYEINDYIYNIMYENYIKTNFILENYNLSQDTSIEIIYKICKISTKIIFKYIFPKRSYSKSFILNNLTIKKKEKLKNKINYLQNIIQPEQRTDAWYIFRNSTLTASNIWKIFSTEYTQNQLIIEKCEPINVDKFKVTNLKSPLHWGQKYEPVSILYYEYIHNTIVSEFGCIPHNKYSFLAASPDGIVCDENSNIYGRMLEIKNVVSREITGIPKMEYWIQMQLQMEVCDLNECDFLETKFTEFDSKEDYINDNISEYKGIILHYTYNNGPHYVYAPFMLNDIECEEFNIWLKKEEEKNIDKEFIDYIYWKIEKISCVLVVRNKFWFDLVVNDIEYFWKVIEKERADNSYKERIKNKRKLELKDNRESNGFEFGKCLL